MLDHMTSAQLTEWLAFSNIEPFGPAHEDFRAGQVAATMANVHRRENTPPYTAADFMPHLNPDAGKPVLLESPDAQSDLILSLFKG